MQKILCSWSYRVYPGRILGAHSGAPSVTFSSGKQNIPLLISWLKERKEHHLPFVEQAYHIKRWNALKINSSLRKVHFVWNFISTAMQVCFLNLGHFLSYKSNFIENLPNFHHTKETCFKKKNNFLPHWAVSSCIYIPLHVPIFCTLKVPSPQSRNWHAVHFEKKGDLSLCKGSCTLPPRNR